MSDNNVVLRLDQIRTDGGTQSRVSINEEVVAEYARNYGSGVDMPPVTVFFDGATYWLADGFHRYWANRKIHCDVVFADVRQGSVRDAILFSVGANASHGLRRTNPDKRQAILTLLYDEEWSRWSDREIARRCGVDHKTVSSHRQSLTGEIPQSESSNRAYKTRHGSKAVMDTRKIKRSNRNRSGNEIARDAFKPIRQPRPALAQTNLNLPHDPDHGARAIVSAMGREYARNLATTITDYLNTQKEGEA